MSSQIERMEKELAELKAQERVVEFMHVLENIASKNYEKELENLIFEEEYGCWVRCCGDSTYPEKIYKQVDNKITEFNNVKYFVAGREVDNIPKMEDIIRMYPSPNDVCDFRIYEGHKYEHVGLYRYTFSSKIWKPVRYVVNNDNLHHIHHILYHLVKKFKQ